MAYLLEKEEVRASSPKDARSMTMVIFIPSSVQSCGGDHGRSSREEVCSVSERCVRKAADKDVLIRCRSHGLTLMAKLAMAGGLPFYS